MYWSTVLILGFTLALVAILLVVRIRAIRRRKRINALVSVWRRMFIGTAARLPLRIRRYDAFTVLNLWNDFHRVRTDTEGISVARLDELARDHRLDALALDLLHRGDAGDRLVALTCLGYLRETKALPIAKALTQDTLGDLSIAAWRLIVLTEPDQFKSFVLELSRHEDWRARTIERLLRELGPPQISPKFASVVEESKDEETLRLLRFFMLCEPSVVRQTVRRLLAARSNPEILAAALRALASVAQSGDRPIVRPLLRHAEPFVRIAAIGALVPICAREDRVSLIDLLNDDNSWVRYRAAQALYNCFADGEDAGELRDVVGRYAREALTQVLAERSALDLRQFVADELRPADGTSDDTNEESIVPRLPMDSMRVET